MANKVNRIPWEKGRLGRGIAFPITPIAKMSLDEAQRYYRHLVDNGSAFRDEHADAGATSRAAPSEVIMQALRARIAELGGNEPFAKGMTPESAQARLAQLPNEDQIKAACERSGEDTASLQLKLHMLRQEREQLQSLADSTDRM